jgi:hypothetical protein
MADKIEATVSQVHGVDRDKLFQTIDPIKASPGLAKFKFNIRNQWLECGQPLCRF